MTEIHPSRLTTTQGWITSLGASFIVGVVFWLAYKWVPDLFPFLIAFAIVRPIYKIWKKGGI